MGSSIIPPFSLCIKHREKSNLTLSNIDQMLFNNLLNYMPGFVVLLTARKLSQLRLHHLGYFISGPDPPSPVEFMLCLY